MTVLGHHSIAELKELIANKDFIINKIRLARAGFVFPDQVEGISWDADWLIFLARYSAAHALADVKINNFFSRNIDPTLVPAEDEYQAVLHALTITPGTTQKGDIGDLVQRLLAAGAKIDFTGAPQPGDTDFDLDIIKGVDKAETSVVKATSTGLKTSAIVLGVGLLGATYLAYKIYIPKG